MKASIRVVEVNCVVWNGVVGITSVVPFFKSRTIDPFRSEVRAASGVAAIRVVGVVVVVGMIAPLGVVVVVGVVMVGMIVVMGVVVPLRVIVGVVVGVVVVVGMVVPLGVIVGVVMVRMIGEIVVSVILSGNRDVAAVTSERVAANVGEECQEGNG